MTVFSFKLCSNSPRVHANVYSMLSIETIVNFVSNSKLSSLKLSFLNKLIDKTELLGYLVEYVLKILSFPFPVSF